MIRRYFYIFSASLFILFTSTIGVKANFEDKKLEELARLTNSPPDGFNYQAVLRDANNDPLASTEVTMQFTLSNTTEDVWIETHTVTTNAFGLITLVIGQGTQSGGTATTFADIDWSTLISVKVESDSGSGFVDLGTSELQSVPYAQYAGNGLTDAQATEITANTAKAGITTGQATDITANTAKVGITTAQASEITLNTAKSGITPEQVTAIGNISGVNTGDQDISGIAANTAAITANETAIALNTAKTGITTDQASEITANTAKVGITTTQANEIATNTAKVGVTTVQTTILDNTSGTNTGDQDISGIATNAIAIALNTAKVSAVFSNTANIIFAGDTDDDFVFGSDQLTDANDDTKDKRMFFDKTSGAFRAGSADGVQWDTPGDFSFAVGINNDASGASATIGGGGANIASISYATVGGGYANSVSGSYATIGGGATNIASGDHATVGGGLVNYATANYATIGGGLDNQAYDNYATVAGGLSNEATGYGATVAGGKTNLATAKFSTVSGGNLNTASNQYSSIGGGFLNYAGADYTTIGGGKLNNATGYYSTTGGGRSNFSAGDYSTVSGGKGNYVAGNFAAIGGGNNVFVQAQTEFGIGQYSSNAPSASADTWVLTDRLFTIGNGTSSATQSNALVMLKNGNTTLNGQLTLSLPDGSNLFTLPNTDGTNGQVLSTNGSGAVSWVDDASGPFANTTNVILAGDSNDDFLFGSAQLADAGNENEDSRVFFDKSKGAFRAGIVNSTEWDNVNVGTWSTVSGGINNIASDISATVGGGYDNNAYGNSSAIAGGSTNAANNSAFVGGGYTNLASGGTSTISGGTNNTASGYASTIGGGQNNTASGSRSAIPGGRFLLAESFTETVIGTYNTDVTPISATSFNVNDRLFVVGNGTNGGLRSDALVMLKNGNTTLNGQLTLSLPDGSDSFTLPNTDGSVGQVLSTDGAGAVTWGSRMTVVTSSASTVSVSDQIGNYLLSHDGSQSFTLTLPTISNVGDRIRIALSSFNPISGSLTFAGTATIVGQTSVSATLSTTNRAIELIFDGNTWVIIAGTVQFV